MGDLFYLKLNSFLLVYFNYFIYLCFNKTIKIMEILGVINVVRIDNCILDSIKSFVATGDEEKHIEIAQNQFKADILELNPLLSDIDVLSYINNEYFKRDGIEIKLVWSDEVKS